MKNIKTFMHKLSSLLLGKKILLIIFTVLIIIIAIIIWTVCSVGQTIVAGGSTSAYPVMQDLTEVYRREPKGKTDILYNAIGSAAGKTFVENKVYTFGFLSEEIKASERQTLADKGIASFAFANDFVILSYHLPDGAQLTSAAGNPFVKPQSGEATLNFLPFNLNYDGHKDYAAFYATHPNAPINGVEQIRRLYNGATWEQAFPGAFSVGGNRAAISFTRENGSGTRLFFESDIIHSNDYKFSQTASSSGAMMDDIKNTAGSVGFMSFDYLDNILSNHQVAIFNVENQLPYVPNQTGEKRFNQSYVLKRPFMGIINTKGPNYKEALKFIAWMLRCNALYHSPSDTNPSNAAYWYVKDGVDPLSPKDYQSYNLKQYDKFPSIYDLVQPYFKTVPGSDKGADK